MTNLEEATYIAIGFIAAASLFSLAFWYWYENYGWK